jgi:hypothetical protein
MKEYELDKSTGEVIFKYDPRIDKPLTTIDIDRLNKIMNKIMQEHGDLLKDIKD